MYPVVIEPDGVAEIINNLKLFSAAGVDNISSKFLKSTKLYSSIILTKIFQQSLNNGEVPPDWKIGKVVPVHKSGSKHSPHNYRPISITSVPSKMLEHILFS